MGVLDKFLDVMKLNDEDDYYDDDFFDDEEEYEEEKPKRRFFRREPDDDYEEEPVVVKKDKQKAAKASANKVTPIRQSKRQGSGMEVCVVKPTSVEDAREITETLLNNRTVVLNLEGLDVEIAQRIIDFTSGACFAIAGNLQKISNYIFIVTPPNVDISGDFQDILNGAFGVPSLHTDF